MTKAATKLDIRGLERADAATLRQLWTAVKDTDPPKTFTARLMRLALAGDVQAAKEGGEATRTRHGWDRISKDRGKSNPGTGAGNAPHPTAAVGTRLLKEWGGATHEVWVTEGGAKWNDRSYSSLSAVARAMTGTNRNGPKFFGMRESAKS